MTHLAWPHPGDNLFSCAHGIVFSLGRFFVLCLGGMMPTLESFLVFFGSVSVGDSRLQAYWRGELIHFFRSKEWAVTGYVYSEESSQGLVATLCLDGNGSGDFALAWDMLCRYGFVSAWCTRQCPSFEPTEVSLREMDCSRLGPESEVELGFV